VAITLLSLARAVVLPLVGLAAKTALVGFRRQPCGPLPLWGRAHLAGATARHVLQLCGRGAFGSHPALLRLYFRLAGARVGRGVLFHPQVKLDDSDLVHVGDFAVVDFAVLHPFQLAAGGRAFTLDRIQARREEGGKGRARVQGGAASDSGRARAALSVNPS
jgi:hypothetical protein